MSPAKQTIRGLRQCLVRARRAGQVALLDEVERGLVELGRGGYRCCLVDYESCRPAYYVRLVGFEHPRVRAELEFPIEPHICPVQLVPLSHLVDYEEAADPAALRRIYEDVAQYLHHRSAPLSRADGAASSCRRPTAPRPGQGLSAGRAGHPVGLAGEGEGFSSFGERRRPTKVRRPRAVRRVLLAAGVWWGIAGVLLSYGLFVFLVL